MFSLPRFTSALESVLGQIPMPGADGRKLCIALSGGLDSTVLLVALSRLRTTGRLGARLRALHVDHGLQADSARWGQACAELAAAHGVACEALRVTVSSEAGASPEAAARTARYAAFAARLEPGEVLLTAHHADDQLETILLQCLRGGGLRAVAGMAPAGPLGALAWHGRPLLEFTRDDLARWAGEQGLRWLEDPSNQDRRFDRNYLRHEVLPALRSRWPAAARTIGRVAEFARDALAAESEQVALDLPDALAGESLSLVALRRLPEHRQRAVLRAWLAGLGLPPPAARTLRVLAHDMAAAAPDRLPETRWPGAVVRRYREHLHAGPAPTGFTARTGAWDTAAASTYAWSEGSALVLHAAFGAGLSRARLPANLAVRCRAGGEVFVPAGGAHRRDLRKWLQERDVLPWRRAQLPLLFAGERLVAVADLGVAAEFAARSDEPSWRLEWTGRGHVTVADVAASRWPLHPPIR